jgi:O6-methylguanine-DNA--protein-cysteine methyltransferase
MAQDPDTLLCVLALGRACEDLVRAVLDIAQSQLRTRAITQQDFDQAFGDYTTGTQRARDMYYQASHDLAQQIASSADLKRLTDETAALKSSLAKLQTTEHVLAISFGAVTTIAAIATAVTAPSVDTIGAAAKTIATLTGTIVSG